MGQGDGWKMFKLMSYEGSSQNTDLLSAETTYYSLNSLQCLAQCLDQIRYSFIELINQ